MPSDGIRIRVARPGDTDAIVRIVNDAYLVESFFVTGNRISPSDVAGLIDRGECLVAEQDGAVAGCIETSVRGDHGYFGMLAVEPHLRKQGVAGRLIEAAEARARAAGCRLMDIKVVNLRTELFPYYERLGYRRVGTEPYEHRPVLQPCHMVLMEKAL